MEETIRRDQVRHFGRVTDRPRHTMQIDWYVYEHDIWNREIPAGRERAASGMAPKLAGRVLTAEACGCLSRSLTSSFPSHGETCAAWHLTGEGEAFAGRGRPPLRRDGPGFGGTQGLGPAPLRRGVRRGRPRRAALRLPLLRRVDRRAAPVRLAAPPPRGLRVPPSSSPAVSTVSIRNGSSSGGPPGRAVTSSIAAAADPRSRRHLPSAGPRRRQRRSRDLAATPTAATSSGSPGSASRMRSDGSAARSRRT